MALIPASIRPKDPLLAAARFLLGFTMTVFVIAVTGLGIGLGVVLTLQARVTARLVAAGAPPEAFWAVIGLMILSGVAMVLGFHFFRHLYRIIGTVGEGDPFVPDNARRLQAMGWIALAVQVMAIPLEMLGRWLEHATAHIDFDVNFSGSGLLMALILFILARVFREGARLRDEVEGTV